jgi:hypothetical protein
MPTRAPDFRFYPANSLSFAFSDNDARIVFGLEEPGSVDPYEQVGVVMTHRTLKLLGELINETIEQYESSRGETIFFDPTKLGSLRSQFEAASASAGAAADA